MIKKQRDEVNIIFPPVVVTLLSWIYKIKTHNAELIPHISQEEMSYETVGANIYNITNEVVTNSNKDVPLQL